MSFKPGDICEIIHPLHRREFLGMECEIVDELHQRSDGTVYGHNIIVDGQHSEHPRNWYFAQPWQLRKKPPPADYDGNQLGDWDLIPWQPSKVREGV